MIVELGYIKNISRRLSDRLKKNEIKPWLQQMWCIPPQIKAAFVCAMDDILLFYKQPLSIKRPLVCMDESTEEIDSPIAASLGAPARYDHEYERNGVCNLFMFYEPFGCKRYVSVTDHRKKVDWASEIKNFPDNHYLDAEKAVLIMDNLNTHSRSSPY